MKQGKGKSVLLSRSPYRLTPVNVTAARVAGLKEREAKQRLQEQLNRATKALDIARTPEEREAALSKVANLKRQLKLGRPDPDIGPRAIRAAKRALERSKWVRSNGRR